MKPRPFFKKLFRVTLTSMLYAGLFLVLYYGLDFLLHVQHPVVAFLITVFITIYFHDNITWEIRKFIDKNFYRKVFALNTLLDRFNLELNSTLDYQVLIEKFVQFLKEAFPNLGWVFYLRWGEDYELLESNRVEVNVPNLINLSEKNLLESIPKETIDFLPLKKFVSKYPQFAEALQQLSNADCLYYVFPMNSYKSGIGLLFFDKQLAYYLHFRSIRRYLIRILNKTADILENNHLYSEVRRKSLQNHLLIEIGKKISATLHLDEVLETIINSVQQLVNYDAAGIFLLDKNRNLLYRSITRGYEEDKLDELLQRIDLGNYGWVIRHKKTRVINDVLKDSNYYEVRKTTRSQVTIPLMNGEDVVGILALESDKLNHFTPMDVELLETFASQIVVAVENAQLYEEALQKRRLESELVVASKVQKALLPERAPHFAGYKISAINIPSRIVGGDFYDFFLSGDHALGVSIGDVSGKGAPASILMAVLYAGFKSLLKEIYPVVEVVARLNNQLTETTTEGYYATFFFGMIDKNTSTFTYTNAGHNPPILLHKDLSFQRLEKGGMVLGFLKDQEYHQETVPLQSGDYLILFTDGVVEVKNSQGQEFGDKRFIKLLRSNYGMKPHELQNSILNKVRSFSAKKDLEDDFTLIIIYVE
ncbi:MAG: hypothetical protein Kow0042_01960 [Calditrichia bacterium]